MRTRIVILSALALLGASLLLFAQNPPAAERLNEAQQMEAQKGLKAAIERYESVLQDFPNDEAAGVAIARIVKLYEIMGKSDDMLNACERLMSRWPKVKDQVSELCVPRTMPGIFIAKMDPQSGVIQDPVRSMTANPRQTEVFPTFSPDGALLAFTRLRNTPRLEAMLDSVIVRSLNDRSERPMKGCGEGSTVGGAHPLWLPDRSLLFVNTLLANSMPPNQPHCIGFNDSQTGELRRSLDYPTQALASAWSAVSPDGKTLYTLLGAAFFNRP
ncbi:MAG TPA: hypothetical protein VFY29_17745, partial [Terriglobia bacterium]|nr:hypothetical protein [Terriglobia bacterium]